MEEQPVTPRPSASLILLRDGEAGPEVLLVQRNPEQRFMGGAWVFPGGATDPGEDDRTTAIRETAEEASVTLAADAGLKRWSRWITPAQGRSMRFDTHFFVARAPADAHPAVDGSECVDWRWTTPSAALAASRDGDLNLRFPTVKHLEQLARYASVEEILTAAAGRRVQPVEPRILTEGGVARVLLPGEPGYDAA